MENFKLTKPLNHVAFIMDGNGRWAKARGLKRTDGHKEGCKRIGEIAEECYNLGIKSMTIYAFSTENWNRPKDEISFLFNYIDDFFEENIKLFKKYECKINVLGDYSSLPIKTVDTINKALVETKEFNKHYFNICLNYGSKQEIIKAVKDIAASYKDGNISLDNINEDSFNDYLYTKDLPPIDLMIRTSGEIRLSNFLLYQLAYSEFVFTNTYWPDFTKDEFRKCLIEYESRNRRYGKIEDKNE